MDPRHKQDAAHGADLAGSVTAGGIGAAFGAAKLRDTYHDEHPDKFAAGLKRVQRSATKAGIKPASAAKITRLATSAKPGFTPLVVGGTAAALATGAQRYGDHSKRTEAKKARRAKAAQQAGTTPVTKSAFGITHSELIAKGKKNRSGLTGGLGQQADALKVKLAGTPDPPPEAPKAKPEPIKRTGKPLRAKKASPSMPKASEMFEEATRAMKGPGKLASHGGALATGAGIGAGAMLIHDHHKSVRKSAFGVEHIEKIAMYQPGRLERLKDAASDPRLKDAARKAGSAGLKAGMEHGKYLAGAAGVAGAGSVGAYAANRARKAAPAVLDRAVAAKFPMPKSAPAVAAAGALGAGAVLLARKRREKETLGKYFTLPSAAEFDFRAPLSAFGVMHPISKGAAEDMADAKRAMIAEARNAKPVAQPKKRLVRTKSATGALFRARIR